jgi:alpha-amylase
MRNSIISVFFILLFINCSKESELNDSLNEPEPIIETPAPTEEIIPTNIWWNDAVFYEIFVRSFSDSDGDGIGDLNGIIHKLDYLNDGNPATDTDLGVTAIWLMPIFPSPSYHGYDVTDYRTINPDYGTLEDFRNLVTQAHARGIKIVIDFVANHTSDLHPWFAASSQNQSKRDWYVWESSHPNFNGPWGQNVWHLRNNSYYYGIFWHGMPDLNFKNEEVTTEIKDVVRYWYEDIGVDGFRIDAVKHWIEEGNQQDNSPATLAWWRDFYQYQKSINPSLMTVGEAWTSTQNIIPYGDNRLDYCFEFDLATSIINSINSESIDELRSKINQVTSNYKPFQYGTFLTNHDQNRVYNQLNKSTAKAKLAASILLSLPGIPYLYYGEEIGMEGIKPDEDIRRPMQWSMSANAGFSTAAPWHDLNQNYSEFNVANQQADPNSLWRHYQKWISHRKTVSALTTGSYKGVGISINSVFPFMRINNVNQESVLILHNLSSTNQNGLTINVITSELDTGTYHLINVENNQNMGTLNIGATGGFVQELDALNLGPQASILMRLEKQ